MSDTYITQGHQSGTGHWGTLSLSKAQLTVRPDVNLDELRSWITRNRKELSDEGVSILADRINAAPEDDDFTRADLFREVYQEVNGYAEADKAMYDYGLRVLNSNGYDTVAEGLSRFVDALASRPATTADRGRHTNTGPDGSPNNPVRLDDPRVQAGEVFDAVITEDGTVFYRAGEDTRPDAPESIRIQADRPLTDAQAEHFAGLLGYSFKVNLSNEGLSDVERDTPYSFLVHINGSIRRSDPEAAFFNLEDDLRDMVQAGSTPRTKDTNHGPAGSQLVPPLDETGMLKFDVYYDRVA